MDDKKIRLAAGALAVSAATLVGIAVVVLIRVLSAHYRWNLPRVAPQEETKA